MDKPHLIRQVIETAEDPAVIHQLAYMVGAQKLRLSDGGGFPEGKAREIMGNNTWNALFMELAKELNVREPKTPDDIYKTHLAEGGSSIARHRRPEAKEGPSVDSAKQNLASTFVNAFVNCGFGKDLLINTENSEWVYKNKQAGMTSAAASVGMIMLWDVENGFNVIDKFSAVTQQHIKAGALLAQGMVQSGIIGDMDAALDLLSEHLESSVLDYKLSAIFGLGLAYAGTARDDVLEKLTPIIIDSSTPFEVVALACLALGMVFVGTCHDGVCGNFIEAFLDRSDTDLKDSNARLMCLATGLLYLGQGEACEGGLKGLAIIEKPIKKYLELTVLTCAYVGSSNVLQVQKLLTVCSEHLEDDEKDPNKGIHQEVALLGIAMVAMGEEVGAEMALRMIDHILQYGEVNIRRAVPIALACLSISNPRLTVMDTLSKLSHDSDQQVSQNSCFSLGLLGAGTNNARIANMLRQLASYYEKEPNHLFVIRVAQGNYLC
jgi:26S proteasome regulatory subunit N1